MPRINLLRNRIFVFLIIGIIILAIPLTVFLVKQQQEVRSRAAGPVIGADTVALVNGKAISKSDLEKSKACLSEKNPNDPQIDKNALDVVVDEKVLSIWAVDNKITVTDKEINDEAVRISGLNPSDCQKMLAKVNLLRQRLSDNLTKFREGKLIVINFDLYANPHPITTPFGVKNEADRIAKLKVDRDYADQLVKSIDSDLKSGKISFEQAIEKVNADEKVGLKSRYGTSLQSGLFTAQDYTGKINLLHDTKVMEQVDKLQEGQFSEPFIQQTNVALCDIGPDCKPEYIDLRWIIVRVDKIGKNYQGTFETVLEKIRNQYHTKIF